MDKEIFKDSFKIVNSERETRITVLLLHLVVDNKILNENRGINYK